MTEQVHASKIVHRLAYNADPPEAVSEIVAEGLLRYLLTHAFTHGTVTGQPAAEVLMDEALRLVKELA